MNAIAYCGLACCVCSENKDCIGCQDGGCESIRKYHSTASIHPALAGAIVCNHIILIELP